MTSLDKTDRILLSTLMLLAFATLMAMVWLVTERIPHLEDEATYLFQARTFARGALAAPVPRNKPAFFLPFVLEVEGGMVGKYPIGWPLLLALGERINMGWVVNPLIGTLTIGLIYLIGRDLFDRDVAVIASILAFTSPFFLIQSANYMSHATTLLWSTLFWLALLRLEYDSASRGWIITAGVAAGMLILTRQLTAGVFGLCVGGILLMRVLKGQRKLIDLLRTYSPVLSIAVLIGSLQPLWLWATTGSPTTNLYLLVWPYDKLGFGPGVGPYEGHTLQQGLITARQDLRLWASELFGLWRTSWIPVVVGIVAGGAMLRRQKRLEWLILMVGPFVLLVAIHVAYWVGAKVYGPRYYYEAHTGLVLLAGAGIVGTVRWLSARWQKQMIWPAYGLVAAMLTISALTYLPGRLGFWHEMYDITPDAITELEAIRETDRVLVLVRGCCWRDYATLFHLNTPWYDGPTVAAHDKEALRTRVLINDQFPDREVWYYNDGAFTKEPTPYTED